MNAEQLERTQNHWVYRRGQWARYHGTLEHAAPTDAGYQLDRNAGTYRLYEATDAAIDDVNYRYVVELDLTSDSMQTIMVPDVPSLIGLLTELEPLMRLHEMA